MGLAKKEGFLTQGFFSKDKEVTAITQGVLEETVLRPLRPLDEAIGKLLSVTQKPALVAASNLLKGIIDTAKIASKEQTEGQQHSSTEHASRDNECSNDKHSTPSYG